MPRPLAGLLLLVSLSPVHATDGVGLTVARVAGSGWRVQALSVSLAGLQEGAPTLQLQARRLELADGQSLTRVRARCAGFRWTPARVSCTGGRFQADIPDLAVKLRGGLSFEYEPSRRQGRLRLTDVALAGGRVAANLRLGPRAWSLELGGKGVQAKAALALLARQGLAKGYTGAGPVSFHVTARGGAGGLTRAQGRLRTPALSFNSADGTRAADHLGLRAHGTVKRDGAGWNIRASLQMAAGQLYIDPLYLKAPARPLTVEAGLRWDPPARRLTVQTLRLDHPGVVQAYARGVLRLGPRPALVSGSLDLRQARLKGLYGTYLQPWLLGGLAGSLTSGGTVSGVLRYQGYLQAVNLKLNDVQLTDQQGRYGVHGLTGALEWSRNGGERHSRLRWSGGRLYRIPLGPAELELSSRGMAFHLRRPARIPLLDGRLLIDSASLENPGSPALRWSFDGVLTPVSMQALTGALGWPELSGRLSGVIPKVRYSDGQVEVGGVLLVRMFGGDITLRDLRLERPFGLVPRLQGNIKVDHINLDTLTRTFSFGQIQGGLSGHVNDLRMVDWQPVAFDAGFATPPDDPLPHRISQRALENLSSIGGGGVTGVLSRSLLRLFQDFPYDKLGISCRLRNAVCDMSGVAPAKRGYYIVKGRFLPPRVDVIGYAHQVDWPTLVRQIETATRAQAPTVK